ncbi:MAG: methylmalonyl-CoA mutase family protein [Ilumatobacteraceae bacterium]
MSQGPSAADELVLAGEFPAAHRDRWLTAVAAALDRKGGLTPEAAMTRLRSTTYDGITIEPLYTAEDAPDPAAAGTPGRPPYVRGRTVGEPLDPDGADAGWDVRQRVDAAAGPGRALTELERGATSVLLDLTGVDTIDADALAGLLDGVLLDLAPVAVQAGPRWADAAEALVALFDRAGLDAASGAGSLGADPIGVAATADGSSPDAELDAVATWFTRLGANRPDLHVVTVDGTRYHDLGASDGQELGCTIAAGVAYLRALQARGVDPAAVFGRLELRLAATGDQFATIAKFRAIRLLWARVAEAVGLPDAAGSTPIHAVTSTAMMTSYDPWVNTLRSTVACFAAGIAGADAVTVLPHDHLRGGEATELGRRIGRNTQSILMRESHLAEVVDPAGGSWYVERFTDELADAAWRWFQELEAAGGLLAAAEAGLVAEQLETTRLARQRDVDTRKAPLTGLTEFPNIAEPPPAGDSGLAPNRWSAGFEALRRRVDASVAGGNARPTIFLATIGTAATFTPRLSFARNVFEVGGVATIAGPPTDDPSTIADAFRTSGATVACLCSSDAVYADHAADVAAALEAAGAHAVYIAGKPQAGIERAVYVGVDVRATLTELLDLLQVP